MATTTAFTTSCKSDLLAVLTGHTIKVALIKVSPAGTYGAASTNYSNITGNSDGVSGTGSPAGGNTLSGGATTTSGTTAFSDWSDTSGTTATISTTACMIYDTTNSNKAISTHDFGGTQTVTGGT